MLLNSDFFNLSEPELTKAVPETVGPNDEQEVAVQYLRYHGNIDIHEN